MRCHATSPKASWQDSFPTSRSRSRSRSSWRPSMPRSKLRTSMREASDLLAAKILVVDDHAANVLLLERMLGDAGYASVTSTVDPHAGRALPPAHRPG